MGAHQLSEDGIKKTYSDADDNDCDNDKRGVVVKFADCVFVGGQQEVNIMFSNGQEFGQKHLMQEVAKVEFIFVSSIYVDFHDPGFVDFIMFHNDCFGSFFKLGADSKTAAFFGRGSHLWRYSGMTIRGWQRYHHGQWLAM